MKRLFVIALFSASGIFGQNYLVTPATTQRSLIQPASASVHMAIRKNFSNPVTPAWKWSLAPLIASHSLDAASSWGHIERNSLLASSGGRFEGKAAGIKFGSVGIAIAAEYFLLKRHPKLAKFIIRANYGNSALTSGLAIHNFVMVH